MKLSVVIVSYNVKHYLEQCLTALQRALSGIDAEVLVVDNHSADGSVEYLRTRFPDIQIISSNHNLGFARANNIAIRRSQGEYVLLLNPDTIVGEHVLADALSFMDTHPDAGGAGVRMMQTDGTDAMESRRGLPSPVTAFYKMCGLCKRFPRNRRFGKYYMGYLDWDKPSQIEVISGAFCLLRRSVLDKVGLLDEDFFMYGEDIDLSYRILKGGFANWYLPLRILHYKGESTQKSSFRYVHVFYGAMLIFFRKHYRHANILLSLPVKAAIYLKAFSALLSVQLKKAYRSLGFFKVYHDETTQYLFIGSAAAMEKCRRLAQEKGLEACFMVGDRDTLPDGHAGSTEGASDLYVVYDIDAYRFEDILNIFSKHPEHAVRMGTYNINTNIIITAEEVLQ